MNTQTTQTNEYHNPDNVKPEQIGEGWRLCLKSEIENPPKDAEFWDSKEWVERAYSGHPLHSDYSYRTRAPLPQDADPYAELKAAHAEGKTIQFLGGSHWLDHTRPDWTAELEFYRIKPEEPQFNCPPIKIGKEVPPSQEEAALAAKMQEALSEKPPVTSDGIPEGCLPFDLDKAMAGHPVTARPSSHQMRLLGRLVAVEGDDACVRWSHPDNSETFLHIEKLSDLFLRALRKVKREGWACAKKKHFYPRVFKTRELVEAEADKAGYDFAETVFFRVEWEDDEK